MQLCVSELEKIIQFCAHARYILGTKPVCLFPTLASQLSGWSWHSLIKHFSRWRLAFYDLQYTV